MDIRHHRKPWTSTSFALALCAGTITLAVAEGDAAAAVAYIRSNTGAPWSETTNEQAMDLVFGVGGWDDLRYESVNPATLYSGTYSFIYMEGSDSNASELQAFMAANQVAIQNWVNAGGGLFLNAAPNEGGNMAWGFGGVTLLYPGSIANPGMAADATHPIWTGPFLPTSPASFTGGGYAHADLSGPGLVALIVDADGGNPQLAELTFGAGTVVFGGLTTSNFWDPNPEALNLRANIIAYLSSGGLDSDDDGVSDGQDNCPDDANPDQEDMDGDDVGDICDPCPAAAIDDADDDQACDDVDNCPGLSNPTQVDDDLDGQGNECDPCPGDPEDDAADGDMICGDVDNCPDDINPNQADMDEDDVGDLCDACPDDPGNDPDEDGVCAASDNCPDDANGDQADADGDGLGDACDESGESSGGGLDTGADDTGAGSGPGESTGLDPDAGGTTGGSDGTGFGLDGDAPRPGDDACACTSDGGSRGLPWLMVVAGAVLRRRRRAG